MSDQITLLDKDQDPTPDTMSLTNSKQSESSLEKNGKPIFSGATSITVSYDSIASTNKRVEALGPSHGKVTGRLLLAVFSAIMGSMQFGYNTGVINAPEGDIKAFMNETHVKRTGSDMNDGTITSLYALTVAIFAVGGMIGGLGAGWWADRFGRKYGMIFDNGISVIACVIMFTSRYAHSFEMIIIGRLVVGIACGIHTGLTPLYLSEIASANLRGALGTAHQLGVVVGLLLSQVLGFPEILGNQDYWHILLGLGVIPCVLQLITIPFCPETPRYLLLKKEQEDEARKSLEILRGTNEVDFDIEEMQEEHRSSRSEKTIGFAQLLKSQSLRRPLIISVFMQISQQFSGINAIFFYSSTLFINAGLDKATAAHATSGVGATMILMTIVTIPLMDRVGRRTFHLIGLGGMFVFTIFITLSLALRYLADWLNYVTIVVSLLYVVSFAIGPGSIPWLIVAELFSQGPRPAAMSISIVINWLANFIVGYTFPYMQEGLVNYSFVPFTVLLGIFWIITFKFVPETKNRTIEEISRMWTKTAASPSEVYEQNVDIRDEQPTPKL